MKKFSSLKERVPKLCDGDDRTKTACGDMKDSTNSDSQDKNEENLSQDAIFNNVLPTLLPSLYFYPFTLVYNQGTLSSGTTYTEYSFTVPVKCQYFKVLLVGAGGHGGSEVAQVSTLSWQGGGGGAGAWAKLLVAKNSFTAGSTLFKVRVGHAANASSGWQDNKGGDTGFYDASGTPFVVAGGGDSGPNDLFEGPGGIGGVVTGSTFLVSSGRGQRGSEGVHFYQSLLVTDKACSGTGGSSAYGDAGTGLNKGTGGWDNGRAAQGYAAGGGGAVHMNSIPGNPTLYGGNGGAGYAEVTFYYQ
jgi:hypothetical protein